jgi:hypothetical protein
MGKGLISEGVDGNYFLIKPWPVEVTFNSLGQMQQLQRPDHVLTTIDRVNQALNLVSDISKDVPGSRWLTYLPRSRSKKSIRRLQSTGTCNINNRSTHGQPVGRGEDTC